MKSALKSLAPSSPISFNHGNNPFSFVKECSTFVLGCHLQQTLGDRRIDSPSLMLQVHFKESDSGAALPGKPASANKVRHNLVFFTNPSIIH